MQKILGFAGLVISGFVFGVTFLAVSSVSIGMVVVGEIFPEFLFFILFMLIFMLGAGFLLWQMILVIRSQNRIHSLMLFSMLVFFIVLVFTPLYPTIDQVAHQKTFMSVGGYFVDLFKVRDVRN